MADLWERVKQWPSIRHLREVRFKRTFETSHDNLFRGVYQTFAEARAEIPSARPMGYNNPEPARMYREVMTSIRGYDYPVLYWLKDNIGDIEKVLDFGGHVGILYYGMSRKLQLPPDLEWIVYDVPAVVEEGRKLAAEKSEGHLSFVTELDGLPPVDLFLASGSPQYVEEPLIDIVSRLSSRPKYIILNMIPLHPFREIITVNSMDVVYCPYKIAHLDAFLSDFKSAGYVIRDQWTNDNKRCDIPFHDEAKGIGYYGLFLTDRDRAGQ